MKSFVVITERKPDFSDRAKILKKELIDFLGVKEIEKLQIFDVYKIYNVNPSQKEEILSSLFNDEVNNLYENFDFLDRNISFRYEAYEGQYNQEQDMLENLVKVYLGFEDIVVKHSNVLSIIGVSPDEMNKIKSYIINPVEAREVEIDKFSYGQKASTLEDLDTIDGFIDMTDEEIFDFSKGFSMDIEDFKCARDYFKSENRNPNMTELKAIDTYWSDHCRHSTFLTIIEDVEIADGKYREIFETSLKNYLNSRENVYGENKKPITLMDLATINMREMRKEGKLDNLEISEEVNAATIEIKVDIDGVEEDWLLIFKNETHNHPTEIEPYGGAHTCIGGGIRDPLSGRSYVYQAMRITGAKDPRTKYADTRTNKLPQRQICKVAAQGYSDYANHIGVCGAMVKEFYHDGFEAKRLELGALVAAVPKYNVVKKAPLPSDLVILIGASTGRDGLGAAVGSSKVQTEDSLERAGAEVQKGNPLIERKIIRLFRNPDATRLIKRCNDFGAGGVAVAVGELADGLDIDLDAVPTKYDGMHGGEIALSESQERMAVVISEKDLDKFTSFVEQEDLLVHIVARVTDKNRLRMYWQGRKILDLSREFLNSNGAKKYMNVRIEEPNLKDYFKMDKNFNLSPVEVVEKLKSSMASLKNASQKALAEKFDNTIGSGTVLSSYGGKRELTFQLGMVGRLPVGFRKTSSCSIFTYGYNPYLAELSPYHAGYYAALESIMKITLLGGEYKKIRMTYQEFFERLRDDESRWGKPFASLLGAYTVMKKFDIAAVGGKDSMSGSFEELDVPPSLIAFSIVDEKIENIVSREFKSENSNVVLLKCKLDENHLPCLDKLQKNLKLVEELIREKKILSTSNVDFGGVAKQLVEMSFGNYIGLEILNSDYLFENNFADIVLEIPSDAKLDEIFKGFDYSVIARTISKPEIIISSNRILLSELEERNLSILDDIYNISKNELYDEFKNLDTSTQNNDFSNEEIKKTKIPSSKEKVRVLIPVFYGTNGEYDLEESYLKAGAEVTTLVVKDRKSKDFNSSISMLAKKLKDFDILALPNGAVFGNALDLPSEALSIALKKPVLRDAIMEHLSKGKLIIGVGTSFTALVKSGLIEFDEIKDGTSIKVIANANDKFISGIKDIVHNPNSVKSPFTDNLDLSKIYSLPFASKYGRVEILNDKELEFSNQIVAKYMTNFTGSTTGIDSMCSPSGRVFGSLSGIERFSDSIYRNLNIKGIPNYIENSVRYFDKTNR